MEEKISFEQFCDPAFRRQEQMKVKSEVVWVAFMELDGLINMSKLAKRYFGKSHAWFTQKLHGLTVCNKKRTFTPEEYKQLADAFRDIARRLESYADSIDGATE